MADDGQRALGIASLFAVVAGVTWLFSRRFYFALAVLLGGLLAASLVGLYLSRPTLLRVAVGPADGKDAQLISAFQSVLEGHRAGVRLRPIITSGLEDNRTLLEKGEADLAIIRADQGLPADSSVVMIVRTNVLVVVAPSKLELESFSQLKGKRLGLLARSPLDERGFGKLLSFFGMQSSGVKLTIIKSDDVGPQTDAGRLDAVLVFGPIVDPEVAAVVYAVDAKKKKGPSILAIDLASLAEKNTLAASEVKIPKKAFSRRGVPDDEVASIGVPTILAGNSPSGPIRAKIRAQAVMELAKNLIERRSELSQKVGYPVGIDKPDNEKGVRLPVHPGASAYLDDTDLSWFTLFSDQIWTVWLLGGAVTTGCVAFIGFMRKPQNDPMRARLERLSEIAEQARTKPDELDALTDELGRLGPSLPHSPTGTPAVRTGSRRSGSRTTMPASPSTPRATGKPGTARHSHD
jgi:TRAP-type uncharacterized transport system substrate-binding protein